MVLGDKINALYVFNAFTNYIKLTKNNDENLEADCTKNKTVRHHICPICLHFVFSFLLLSLY